MILGVPDIAQLEKRSWQSILFGQLTLILLTLGFLILIFPGVLDRLPQFRAEGSLDVYTTLLVVIVLFSVGYVLYTQWEIARLRRRMVDDLINLRSLEDSVAQLKRLMHVAASVHMGQRLDETLQVLVNAAHEALKSTSVTAMVRRGGGIGPFFSAGAITLNEEQVTVVGEQLKDSREPLVILNADEIASLLGELPGRPGGLLAVPMRDSHAFLGVLVAFFGSPASAKESPLPRVPLLDLLGIFSDSAIIAVENESLVRRIEQQAYTDELTGLSNRRYFNREVKREIARAERMKSNCAMVVFDLDHFKTINDKHGHDTGDQALCRVARALGICNRKSNLLARFGGDELISLLIDSDREGAEVAAERMRAAVAAIKDLPVPLTISIGVALYPEHGSSAEALLRSADRALYAAKAGGRNQVRFADGPSDQASDFAEANTAS